jgi:hypothetical protein
MAKRPARPRDPMQFAKRLQWKLAPAIMCRALNEIAALGN